MQFSKKFRQSHCVIGLSLFLISLLCAPRDSFAQSAVQVASATPQSSTAAVTVSYSSAQTAGDLNVVVVGWNDTTAKVQSITDSVGNSYRLAIGPTIGTGLQQSIYYAANVASGKNTVTVSFNQAAAYPDVRILEYRGLAALDVTAGATGSSATSSSGAATTRNASELIFGANTVGTMTTAPGGGFTSRIITSPDGDIAEDKAVTAVGSNSATATLSATGPWVMQMVGFTVGSSPAPTVTTVSPNNGPTAGGTVVTISGTNFAAGATVTVGSVAATNVAVVNSTTITATTPSGIAGAATVTVTNSGGQSASLGSAFTYIAGSAVLPAPIFSLPAGTYTNSTLTMSDSTSGATIYYTSNGSTPTTSSAVYKGAIALNSSGTFTFKAMAAETGYSNSPVTTVTYTIHPTLARPTFSPPGGSYTGTQPVTLSDVSAGVTIYYTTDGSTPTTSSSVYSAPITVNSSKTINAIAALSGWTNSPVATASYTMNGALPPPTFSPAAGTYTSAQSVTISDATSGTTIYYTTNGTTPTTSSTKYIGPISVSSTETIEAIAVKSGSTNSAIGTAAYTISSVLPTPTFSPAAGTYSSAQSVAISDATSGTTIYYTTNGTTPTTSSTKYSGPISVSSTETIEAIAVKSGSTNSVVATASYTISSVLPTPTFSPTAGTFASAQSVTISDATSGAAIYYTTNGATPTTSSTKYSGPISVSSTETIEAMAVESGYTNSAVASATYSIAAAAPTFSVPAGTYTSTQSVAISDATPGATIYYTTNGTMPTTSSTKYAGPISVSATETISAIAIATGYVASPEAVANYIISSTHSVTLSWDAPTSSTDPVVGYDIYRAVSGSSSYQLLNLSVDTETTYVDSTAKSGATYIYYVESVDSSGNQSVPSNQVSVTVP